VPLVKLFVVIRDEAGLRRVDVFHEEEAAKAGNAKATATLHDLVPIRHMG
jgi:hypothetical protein